MPSAAREENQSFKRGGPIGSGNVMRLPLVAGLMSVLVLGMLAGCVQGSSKGGTPTPAQAREPKGIVDRLTINMGEEGSSFHFTAPGGSAGGPFHVASGKLVGIHLVNAGLVEHEMAAGRGVKYVAGEHATNASDRMPDGYNESMFESLPADVFVYKPQKVETGSEGGIKEFEAEPGADLWIRTTFPDSMKGTWEIGCFKPGHYQGGMKASLIIE